MRGLRRLLQILAVATAVSMLAPALAQAPKETPPARERLEPVTAGSPVRVWNRTITTLYAPYGSQTPEVRARNAERRIGSLIDTLRPQDLEAQWVVVGNAGGVIVSGRGQVLVGLHPQDAGAGTAASREATLREGKAVVQRLSHILVERARMQRPRVLLEAIGLSLFGTVVAVLLAYAAGRLRDRLQSQLRIRAAERLHVAGFDMGHAVHEVARRLIGIAWFAVVGTLGYLWLGFVLRRFPYSRPWGDVLANSLVDAVARVASGFVDAIPSLIMLLIIWLVTRTIVRIVRDWFEAIRNGTITVSWCDPAIAPITSRLITLLIWVFGLMLAYPHIPGAQTDAFKGISVFLGLVLSLGSAGIIGQLMSGAAVLYTRAIRVGDFVRIGEHEGVVTQMGALSIKLVNRLQEEYVIPNSMLSSSPVHNFTHLSGEAGLGVMTKLTIGYDAPWRQVHALLQLAASRTPGVLAEPKPIVLQAALTDFYVEYRLIVWIAVPKERPIVLSRLHAEIQDAFNEHGVQIMSPNFEAQPDHKVWVPRERWHEKPADHSPAGPPDAPG
ncbi:MAG TPA: mechanosensitive ion channel domain-containing protein [Lysobacter sp.]|nr:mechanosensitive ion channel domain-containing protein [Lysobacter sp.]